MAIFELHQSPLNTDLCIKIYNIQILTFVDHPAFLIFIFRDGAELCGMFCAIHNCIQQLQMDGDIDVFSTVRQLQIRRPEFCSSQVYIFSICQLWKNLAEAIFLLKLEILIMHSKVVLCILYLFRYKGWIQHDLQSHKRPNPEWKWKSV